MNWGFRPVTLSACGVLLPNRKQFVIPGGGLLGSDKLPCELTQGKNCSVIFSLSEVVTALRQEGFSGRVALRAVFRDALGGEHKSERFVGNIEDWFIASAA